MSAKPFDLPRYAGSKDSRHLIEAMPAHLRLVEPLVVDEDWFPVGRFHVHLDRWRAQNPRAVVVLVHGGGGTGRLLAPFGQMCVSLGLDAVAPDLPGYGLTQVPSKSDIEYEDWRAVVAAVIENEAARGLTIIVFGVSMGGLVAYDATARTRVPKGLIATCFLDPSDMRVRRAMGRWPWLGTMAGSLLTKLPQVTDKLPIPMRLAGNMKAVANEARMTQAIVADPRAGGNWMTGRFLRTYLTSRPEVAPDLFDVCPVLLAHPADDRWTDVSVSRTFFDRLEGVETELVMLEEGGHLPIERAAYARLTEAIDRFVSRRCGLT